MLHFSPLFFISAERIFTVTMPINQPAVCQQQLQQMTGGGGSHRSGRDLQSLQTGRRGVSFWRTAWMDIALLLGVLGSFAQLQLCFKHFSAVARFFCLSNGVQLLFRGCYVSVGV